jgi:hypothetical protein
MTTILSEKSTAIAKLALELQLKTLQMAFIKGDDDNLARALDEIRVAISELGTFNTRTEVHYDRLKIAYRMYPPQADHIDAAICQNCNNLHIFLRDEDNKAFAEAVISEAIGVDLIDAIHMATAQLRLRKQ